MLDYFKTYLSRVFDILIEGALRAGDETSYYYHHQDVVDKFNNQSEK